MRGEILCLVAAIYFEILNQAKSEKADHHRQIKAMPTFHLYKVILPLMELRLV